MSYPWAGAAKPLHPDDFLRAAERLGCDDAVIRAVWQVESAGRPFRADGTLERRFEPHHMPRRYWDALEFDPGSAAPWRASLAIKRARREAMFLAAYELDPDATLRACSWGGPQIMGFNAADCGFGSAREMVAAMAEAEAAQLDAFVAFIRARGLDSALRAHDWDRFEQVYNGGGFGGAYARKIEAAYRALSGRASPAVLRVGSAGAAVRRVQAILGVATDGRFGPETEDAVRRFQARNKLAVDGVVGARTWAVLEAEESATPPQVQPTPADKGIERVIDWGTKGGGGALAWRAIEDNAPPQAVELLFWGLIVIGLLVAAALAAKWLRRA